jgi:hypothetical protein
LAKTKAINQSKQTVSQRKLTSFSKTKSTCQNLSKMSLNTTKNQLKPTHKKSKEWKMKQEYLLKMSINFSKTYSKIPNISKCMKTIYSTLLCPNMSKKLSIWLKDTLSISKNCQRIPFLSIKFTFQKKRFWSS